MNYKDNYKHNFFNNPCATHIFLMCKVYNTASMLAKKTEITHPYVFRIVKILEKYKLVSTKKVGKFRYLKLTEKGEFIHEHLTKIMKCLEEKKE